MRNLGCAVWKCGEPVQLAVDVDQAGATIIRPDAPAPASQPACGQTQPRLFAPVDVMPGQLALPGT